MADIILDGIHLPGDLHWIDEFSWIPVGQAKTIGLDGTLILQESTIPEGRPITLQSIADNSGWITRSVLLSLYAKVTLGRIMTLILADTREFTVSWRMTENPIDAKPTVIRIPIPATQGYTVTLRLMERTS